MADLDPLWEEDDDDSEDYETSSVQETKKPRIVYHEELIMTPEERAERQRKRTMMSKMCIDSLWKLYDDLTYVDEKIKDMDRGPEPDWGFTVAKKPSHVYERIKKKIKKKFGYLERGIMLIKEAPAPPYVRPQEPLFMHQEGRHMTRIEITNAFHFEIEPEYIHPVSFAYRSKSLKVRNTNFFDDDDEMEWQENLKEASTQVVRDELRVTESRYRKFTRDSTFFRSQKESNDGEYDLEDYPLDDQGNPIGKTTGFCEWCRGQILPIPTPYILLHTEDKDKLYCCGDYRKLIEDTIGLENKERAEYIAKNLLIPIKSSHAKTDLRVKGKGSAGGDSKDAGAEATEEEMEEKKKRKEEQLSKNMKILKAKEKAAARRRTEYLSSLVDESVDTEDLPWDPYMSRFGHPYPFKDGEYDDPESHCYTHVEVLITQTELYGKEQGLSAASLKGQSEPKNNSNFVFEVSTERQPDNDLHLDKTHNP